MNSISLVQMTTDVTLCKLTEAEKHYYKLTQLKVLEKKFMNGFLKCFLSLSDLTNLCKIHVMLLIRSEVK